MTDEVPAVPGDEAKAIAISVNRNFSPPLHEQAGVTEDEIAVMVGHYIEIGLLVPDGHGSLVVPPAKTGEWSALPDIVKLIGKHR